jgi:hybrid cluster-associated redox disulfide protein
MKYEKFSDLCVAEIMQHWPSTIGVFIDLNMHCIGCPIGSFHTLADAADEHGLLLDALAAEVSAAIDGETRAGPERVRRRSAAGDAGPSPAASAGHPPPGPRPPRP